MRIRHFYHVYAEGAWTEPANEHVQALISAGFIGQITVSLVGPPSDRRAARNRLSPQLALLHSSPVDWIESDTGFEQVTLSALRAWAHASRGDVAVLYAHTKGAYAQTALNAIWRRSMTHHVIYGWRQCVRLLAEGYDAVGCHWLKPGDAPPPYTVESPYFGGNFWWATAAHLRKLPPVASDSRFDAEGWIGLASPRVSDLRPGWPNKDHFSSALATVS